MVRLIPAEIRHRGPGIAVNYPEAPKQRFFYFFAMDFTVQPLSPPPRLGLPLIGKQHWEPGLGF